MNWEAIGAIGEILGAAGVIATLAYLAVQIRQNTKTARAATRQELAGQMQMLASDLVTDEGIASILQDHLEGKELTSTELLRLGARAFRDLRFFDNALFQYSQGLLTDDEWRALRENLKAVLRVEAYRDYWSREHSLYSRAFQSEVASALEEPLEAAPGTLILDAGSSGSGSENQEK
ncbi:MAG: hypothetical protein OES26_27665 [Gammaproteobacteria bacterium]|nr:hypothetical protein [Gammaproteobacteria bacterium]